MVKILNWALAAMLATCLVCQADVPAEPYGLAFLASVASETSSGVAVSPFQKASQPSPGRRLEVCVDANTDCRVLVVAFNQKDHRLSNKVRPQLLTVKDFRAAGAQEPPPPRFDWSRRVDPFGIYVVFLRPSAPGLDDLQKLVAAMQDAAPDDALLDLQTAKLWEQVARWMARRDAAAFHAGKEATSLAGLKRAPSDSWWRTYPWQQQAAPIKFDASGRAIVVYPVTSP